MIDHISKDYRRDWLNIMVTTKTQIVSLIVSTSLRTIMTLKIIDSARIKVTQIFFTVCCKIKSYSLNKRDKNEYSSLKTYLKILSIMIGS